MPGSPSLRGGTGELTPGWTSVRGGDLSDMCESNVFLGNSITENFASNVKLTFEETAPPPRSDFGDFAKFFVAPRLLILLNVAQSLIALMGTPQS
jgi:hypothetical protein